MEVDSNKVFRCDDGMSVIVVDEENEKLLMYDSWNGCLGFSGEGILSEINSEAFDKIKEFFDFSDDDMNRFGITRIVDDFVSMKN